jgi:uncharacterized protein involved in exopolysaccharide biosynthesis
MMDQLDDQKATRGVDEYWAIVRRRKWWIIGPLFFGWLLVFLSAWIIPAKYTSESVILIEQQKVPEHYVKPNVQVDLGERLNAITQQVLSRQRLLSIINRFHLYQSFLTPTPDDQLKKMRSDIKIDLVETPSDQGKRELTAFKLQYAADNSSIAQQVNMQMVSYFIDENVKASQEQSESTTQFLDQQLKNAQTSLTDQENKMREFEKAHMGELPQEAQATMQMLSGAQQQLGAAIDARQRALQQQAYLQSLAAQYDAAGVNNLSTGGKESIDTQIENAQSGLADLEAKYTPDHPDVKKMKDTIAKLQALKDKQQSGGDVADSSSPSTDDSKSGTAATTADAGKTDNGSKTAGSGKAATGDKTASADKKAASDVSDIPDVRTGTTASQLQALGPVMQVQSQLKANKMEIQNREAEIRSLEAKIGALQGRLSALPMTQAGMMELNRDYEQTKKNYDDLLEKKNSSALATNLQRQQQGENFRIIDPPSMPEKASFPDRFKFSLAGLAVGLGLAVLFGAGSEYLDDRIRSEQDLAEASPLPILAEIPPLPTEREIQAERWKPWIAVAAAILVVIIIPTGILYAFYWG